MSNKICSNICSYIFLFVFIVFHYKSNAQNSDTVNLALYKTATASSIESVNYPASKAVDDDISTKWSSSSSNYKQSLTVDLGQKYSINKVQIIWADTYFSNVYDIQLSDDNTNWSTIKRLQIVTHDQVIPYKIYQAPEDILDLTEEEEEQAVPTVRDTEYRNLKFTDTYLILQLPNKKYR